jgi:hypothetical protein
MPIVDLGGCDVIANTFTPGVAFAGYGGGGVSVPPVINAGSTLTISPNTTVSRTIALNALTGSVVTLPTATGSGTTYTFIVTVLATSNSHIIQCANATDNIQGFIVSTLSGTPTTNNTWFAVADTDTITLNRTTTGSVTIGERITLRDIATNVWQCEGQTSQSGTAATPFSDTVG